MRSVLAKFITQVSDRNIVTISLFSNNEFSALFFINSEEEKDIIKKSIDPTFKYSILSNINISTKGLKKFRLDLAEFRQSMLTSNVQWSNSIEITLNEIYVVTLRQISSIEQMARIIKSVDSLISRFEELIEKELLESVEKLYVNSLQTMIHLIENSQTKECIINVQIPIKFIERYLKSKYEINIKFKRGYVPLEFVNKLGILDDFICYFEKLKIRGVK